MHKLSYLPDSRRRLVPPFNMRKKLTHLRVEYKYGRAAGKGGEGGGAGPQSELQHLPALSPQPNILFSPPPAYCKAQLQLQLLSLPRTEHMPGHTAVAALAQGCWCMAGQASELVGIPYPRGNEAGARGCWEQKLQGSKGCREGREQRLWGADEGRG